MQKSRRGAGIGAPGSMTDILQAKLERPRLGDQIVRRSHLEARLTRGLDQRLTLICAPAGFGKTTLLSEWLDGCPHPSAWLTLDGRDNDPRQFVRYVCAAICTVFPDACPQTRALINVGRRPPAATLSRTLLEECSALPGPLVLALDDYHAIKAQSVHDIVAELLRYPSPTLHVLLSTREDPPLPLAGLRAGGHLTELRGADLRFSEADVSAYLERVTGRPVSPAVARRFHDRTEGWVVGLYLATLATRLSDGSFAIDSDTLSIAYVSEYLRSEIIDRQPPELRDFLLKTSILDHLCAPLCDAVATPEGGVSSQQTLDWMVSVNLFTTALDDRGQWYRYHPLLREALRRRLTDQLGPDHVAALHLNASAWYAKNGMVEEAVRQAIAAGEIATATKLFIAHRHDLINAEQWQQLDEWLRLFPQPTLDSDPELLMAHAWLAFSRSALHSVAQLLERIDAWLSGAGAGRAGLEPLLGERDWFRGWLLYNQGSFADAHRATSDALARLPAERQAARGLAWLIDSASVYALAGPDAGYRQIHQVLQSDEASRPAVAFPVFVARFYLGLDERGSEGARTHSRAGGAALSCRGFGRRRQLGALLQRCCALST